MEDAIQEVSGLSVNSRPLLVMRVQTLIRLQSSSGSSRGRSSRSTRSHRRGRRRSMYLAEALQKLTLHREVVPPSKFDPRSGGSLKKFFRDFERYFDAKYDGTDGDKSAQLGCYLLGSAKSVYEAIGGSGKKYSKVKPKLLDWYTTERTSGQQTKFTEFQQASMRPTDSLRIYCLRLEQLALGAFPNSGAEYERQLKRKFLQTVPGSFIAKMETAQSSLALQGQKCLSWDQMKKIAESEDRMARERMEVGRSVTTDSTDYGEEPTVWFSQPVQSPAAEGMCHAAELTHVDRHMVAPRGKTGRQGASPPFRTRQYYNSSVQRAGATPPHAPGRSRTLIDPTDPQTAQRVGRSPPRSFSLPQRTLLCHWCGRRGHTEERCWLKLGACTKCGSADHSESHCVHSSERSSHLTFKCPICSGGHLGKDCPVGTSVSEASN